MDRIAAPIRFAGSALKDRAAAGTEWHVDRGADFYEAQHRRLQINSLKRKAAQLGFQITEVPAA